MARLYEQLHNPEVDPDDWDQDRETGEAVSVPLVWPNEESDGDAAEIAPPVQLFLPRTPPNHHILGILPPILCMGYIPRTPPLPPQDALDYIPMTPWAPPRDPLDYIPITPPSPAAFPGTPPDYPEAITFASLANRIARFPAHWDMSSQAFAPDMSVPARSESRGPSSSNTASAPEVPS